ncbi:MAG TPA: hypothetical protein PKI14_01340 [Fervidobacterium sp.]|nr:hypothetical protein [Fervidobacterium sp.]
MKSSDEFVADFQSYEFGCYRRVGDTIELKIPANNLGYMDGAPIDSVTFFIKERLLPRGINIHPNSSTCHRIMSFVDLHGKLMPFYNFIAKVEGWETKVVQIPSVSDKGVDNKKIVHKWTADLQGVDSQYPDRLEFDATEGFSNVTMKYIAGEGWTKPNVDKVIAKIEISDLDKTKFEVLSQGTVHHFEMPNGREYEVVKLISAFWKLKKKFTGRDWAEPARLTNIKKNDKVSVTVGGKEYKVSSEKVEQLEALLSED